jgi:hypothetical protein
MGGEHIAHQAATKFKAADHNQAMWVVSAQKSSLRARKNNHRQIANVFGDVSSSRQI